jgi:hypothetical protein
VAFFISKKEWCDMNTIYINVVKMHKDLLTDDELAGINLAYALGSVKANPAYSKVKGLFTAEDGTKMHPVTLDAFTQVVFERLERLGEPKSDEGKKFMDWYENKYKPNEAGEGAGDE